MFLLYLLTFLTRPPRSHQNRRSHGSAFLRQGAVVFGVGSLLYFISNLVTHFLDIECSGEDGTVRIAVEILIICLFTLQVSFTTSSRGDSAETPCLDCYCRGLP